MRLFKLAILFVVGCVVGIVAAALVGRFVIYPELARQKYEYGHQMGVLQAQIELGGKIPEVLGRDVDPHESMVPFFSAKTESVVVVTRHGVKTLRLCCDGSEPEPSE
jgi:hypothetical protein